MRKQLHYYRYVLRIGVAPRTREHLNQESGLTKVLKSLYATSEGLFLVVTFESKKSESSSWREWTSVVWTGKNSTRPNRELQGFGMADSACTGGKCYFGYFGP